MVDLKKISFVILTFNSQQTLGACLKAIEDLDYPAEWIETVLLDNGSKDRTIEIAQQFGYKPTLLPELNLSELRNYGAHVATRKILAYIDSDCVIAADWLTQIVKWFDDPSVGIVGNEYLLPDNSTIFERNWYGKSNYGIKYDDLIPAGNMAIRKDYFHKLGGFDNKLLTGEDDYILEVFRQAGYKTISDHQVCSEHLGNAKNLKEYFKKETWYGQGMLGTLHLSKLDKPLIGTAAFFSFLLFSSIFFSFYLCLTNDYLLVLASCALLGSLAVPLLSAADRVYRKKRKGKFFFVTIIFIVFFMARLNALFYVFRRFNRMQ